MHLMSIYIRFASKIVKITHQQRLQRFTSETRPLSLSLLKKFKIVGYITSWTIIGKDFNVNPVYICLKCVHIKIVAKENNMDNSYLLLGFGICSTKKYFNKYSLQFRLNQQKVLFQKIMRKVFKCVLFSFKDLILSLSYFIIITLPSDDLKITTDTMSLTHKTDGKRNEEKCITNL